MWDTEKREHVKFVVAVPAGNICMVALMMLCVWHPDETAESAVGSLWHAVAWYTAQGMKVEHILTDNGACNKSRKFREACREFGIQHKRTRPYRPQANGKAERFIQTALKERAYAQTYTHSWKRTAYLSEWTHHYNFVRPHSALGRKPPASCLNGG